MALVFGGSLQREFRGTRIAWSADLGGLPVEPAVTAVLESQRGVFTDMGCEVEEASPDLSGADEVFQTLRGVSMASSLGPLLDQHPASFKETIVWNVELGRALTGAQVAAAMLKRSQIFDRMRVFMEKYEFLIAPVNQVVPFAIEQEYPTRDQRREDGHLPRLDALVLGDNRHGPPVDLGPVRIHAGRPARWACKSSAAIATNAASCNSLTPSNNARASPTANRRRPKSARFIVLPAGEQRRPNVQRTPASKRPPHV